MLVDDEVNVLLDVHKALVGRVLDTSPPPLRVRDRSRWQLVPNLRARSIHTKQASPRVTSASYPSKPKRNKHFVLLDTSDLIAVFSNSRNNRFEPLSSRSSTCVGKTRKRQSRSANVTYTFVACQHIER
jgi:hypothetical protein